MSEIRCLIDKFDQARVELEMELERMFPRGNVVEIKVNVNQKNLSRAIVVDFEAVGALIIVRLEKPGKWGRHATKRVHYRDVSACNPAVCPYILASNIDREARASVALDRGPGDVTCCEEDS